MPNYPFPEVMRPRGQRPYAEITPPDLPDDFVFTKEILKELKRRAREYEIWGCRNYGGGEDGKKWRDIVKRGEEALEKQKNPRHKDYFENYPFPLWMKPAPGSPLNDLEPPRMSSQALKDMTEEQANELRRRADQFWGWTASVYASGRRGTAWDIIIRRIDKEFARRKREAQSKQQGN